MDYYINSHRDISIEDMKDRFQYLMEHIKKFKIINSNTKILEIGSGLGWFQIICSMEGINCKGIDISPQLVRFAKDNAKRYDIEVDIEVGNVENKYLGFAKYDVIIAEMVFEHVKLWRKGIKNIYNALKPNGLFFFTSTNKFALINGELNFPFYGWFPNKLRYKIKIWFRGKDTMKLGIDYHQFTHFHLRRFFNSLRFSKVIDVFDIIDLKDYNASNLIKQAIIKICKQSKLLKNLILFFTPSTYFICIK